MVDIASSYLLITSGGTEVPIDPVRSIKNKSTGHFATSIARAALKKNIHVIFLASATSETPFSMQIDLNNQSQESIHERLNHLENFSQSYQTLYHEYRFTTFAEYHAQLKHLCSKYKPSAVILAAAVSDYLTDHYVTDKIRTQHELAIQLKAAPKIIQLIKQWLPHTFLIGFKMLVDAPEEELYQVALQGFDIHHADLIVANNLKSIEQHQHEVLLMQPCGLYKKINNNISETIIEALLAAVSL